jgi:hypothetical protein
MASRAIWPLSARAARIAADPYARPVTGVRGAPMSTVRGGLLGLMLGDALGAGERPDAEVLPATCAGQLACFTMEGLIRASVRFSHRGVSHPPAVVWHAYARWAALQGITGIERRQADGWPDGWLAQVPALRARRGAAPATVAGTQAEPRTSPSAPASARTR